VSSAPTSPTGGHIVRIEHNARPPGHARRGLEVAGELSRYLTAFALLGVGAVHAQQYYESYFYAVPTIGTLFLLSFIGAAALGAALLAPTRRLLGSTAGNIVLVLAAFGAIGIALGSLVSLLVSEYTPLFGFMESGYRLAIVLALATDGLTTAFATFFLAAILSTKYRSNARRR
jgi:hypothetical protein